MKKTLLILASAAVLFSCAKKRNTSTSRRSATSAKRTSTSRSKRRHGKGNHMESPCWLHLQTQAIRQRLDRNNRKYQNSGIL